jgi:transcriptional regulator with XRE-family HTH domain
MASKDQTPAPKAATIGSRLRKLRKERSLTQAELARQIGIQQSDLSRMEKGEYRVSLDNLFKILSVFDLRISEFFADHLERSQPARQPLSQRDMQILHMLRELGPDSRQEIEEFIEFKVRRERSDRRAADARKPTEAGS